MIAEIGNTLLFSALSLSLIQVWFSYKGYFSNVIKVGSLIFFALFFSFISLVIILLANDFSVKYVFFNSNIELPWYYKITASWGAHEGSILFWTLLLSLWNAGFLVYLKYSKLLNNKNNNTIKNHTSLFMGFILSSFIFFTAILSNPFARIFPNQSQLGLDLNPLLQDFGMIIHPPIIYMGYVGFSVVGALALAILYNYKSTQARLNISIIRFWVLLAWGFLSAGIILGSWWAYRELGWGGYWFWDPVENTSLIPWLLAGALVHLMFINKETKAFSTGSALLAIITFISCIFATFIVRSGLLTSVHAFANDPIRGNFILGVLAILIVITIYAYIKAKLYDNSNKIIKFNLRHILFLVNNALLFTMSFTLMIGIIYPLILEYFFGKLISVGTPYYEKVMSPLAIFLMLFLALALLTSSITKWKLIFKNIFIAIILSLVVILIIYFIFGVKINLGLGVLVLVAIGILYNFYINLLYKSNLYSYFISSKLGANLAHLSIVIIGTGMLMMNLLGYQKDFSLGIGEKINLSKFEITLLEVKAKKFVNYKANIAKVLVITKDGQAIYLYPETRLYNSGNNTSEAAIKTNMKYDTYMALGSLRNNKWALRFLINPGISLIWLGGILLFLAISLSWIPMIIGNIIIKKA